MKTISFIGCGNMGGAVARAVCKAIDPTEVVLYNIHAIKAEKLASEIGCGVAYSLEEAVRASKYVMFCVKPQFYEDVAAEMIPVVKSCVAAGQEKVLASVMAGVAVNTMEKTFADHGMDLGVIRVLPNTPVAVGRGMFLVVGNEKAKARGYVEELMDMMRPGGLVEESTERIIDIGSNLYSASPAWGYMFIEALADGGVAVGVPRAQAMRYAAQGVLGAAALLLATGMHPGELKDQVCSPGGLTIAGVATLEQYGLRNAVIQAVLASEEKRREIAH